MKTKRIFSSLLALTLLFSIVGCNGSGKETSSSQEPSKSESAGESGGEISGKLSIWSWGAGREKEARELAVNVFIDKYPELDVEHIVLPTADSVWDQKSQAAFASQEAGDVMQMSPDYYGLMTRYYEDLNSYVEKDDIDFSQVVTEGMMDGYYRPDGKLEALPLLANCFVFAYNKDMFDEAGIDYPTDDRVWTDRLKMAPDFIGGEGVDRTYFLSYHWVMPNFGIIATGGEPYNDDFTKVLINDPKVEESLNLFGEMVEIGGMPNSVAAENLPGEQMFVAGKAAVYPMGGFEIASVTEAIGDNFEWAAVKPPKDGPNGSNTNMTYATGYAMNADAKNKDAAWLFLKEVSYANDEMAKETAIAGIPANKSVAEGFYAQTRYNEVSTTQYVDGLATSRLNIWGGALASAGDQYSQIWESVTIAGETAADAIAEYFPLLERAFTELNIEN